MSTLRHSGTPTTSHGVPGASRASDLLAGQAFLLRRLHSLSGIVPVGLFTIGHLFTNAQMLWGQEADGSSAFQHEVDFLHNLPFLLFIEIGIWASIGFHAALGVWYTFTGKQNIRDYAYGGNIRYFLQRVTGLIALVFIFLHIATLRWRWDIFGWYTPFWGRGYQAGLGDALASTPLSLPLTAYALQFHVMVALFYLIGVLAVVFHWSNGLWTAAISWGLTITEGSMKRWGYVCAGLFVALTAFFGAAFVAALAFDFDDMSAQQKAAFVALIDDGATVFDDRPALAEAIAAYGLSFDERGGLISRNGPPTTDHASSSSAAAWPASPRPSASPRPACRSTCSPWSRSSARTASAPRAASTPATRSRASRATPSGALRRDALRRRLPQPPAARLRDGPLGAPVIDLLDRMGVPFNRTEEGQRDLRLFGGSLFKRTHFAGATTGQQLLYALDEQTRRFEARARSTSTSSGSSSGRSSTTGRVPRRGHRRAGHAHDADPAFRADAVVMATGGNGLVFGKSTNSSSAPAPPRPLLPRRRGLRQPRDDPGPPHRHPRRRQVPPHERVGPRRGRPRLGAPQEGRQPPPRDPRGERWYFLEEKYPKYGNLVPRDIATREIFDVCVNQGTGVGGGNMVYLDLTHKPGDTERKLAASWRSTRSSWATTRAKSHEDLPRRPLLHGRPLHELRGRAAPTRRYRPARPGARHRHEARRPGQHAHQHPGPLRLRRV
jgi:succinate dehydrogenase / fumarate reductase, cytochrome b subunit